MTRIQMASVAGILLLICNSMSIGYAQENSVTFALDLWNMPAETVINGNIGCSGGDRVQTCILTFDKMTEEKES